MTDPAPPIAPLSITRFARADTRSDDPTAGAVARLDGFASFVAWMRAGTRRNGAEKAGECIILGATSEGAHGPRSAPEAVSLIGLDFDDCPLAFDGLVATLRDLPGRPRVYVHTTFSHGLAPKWRPGTTRARAFVELARPLTPDELRAIVPLIGAKVAAAGALDRASREAGRLWYTPRPTTGEHVIGFRDELIDGEPLDPDGDVWALAEAVAVAAAVAADRARDEDGSAGLVREATDREARDTGAALGVDLRELLDDRITKTTARGFRTSCPWEHEHSSHDPHPAVLDRDANGEWRWRCFHDSCSGRGRDALVEKLGAGKATAGIYVRGVTAVAPRPIEDVRADMGKAIRDALDGPERDPLVVRVSVGAGKTRKALLGVLELFRPGKLPAGAVIAFVCPTVALATQAADRLAKLARERFDAGQLRPGHFRRVLDALDGDNGKRLSVLTGRRAETCERHDEYREADARGPREGAAFCAACPLARQSNGGSLCEYVRARRALDKRRRQSTPTLIFATHAGHQSGLGLGHNADGLDPYATIVDEAPAAVRATVAIKPSSLRAAALALGGDGLDRDAIETVERWALRAPSHGVGAGVRELLDPIRVPRWEALAALDEATREAILDGATWRDWEAVASASERGWIGAYLLGGQIHTTHRRPWRRGKRTIVLDATTTHAQARDLFGSACSVFDAAAEYHDGSTVIALSGPTATTDDLRSGAANPDRPVGAILDEYAKAGALIVLPSRRAFEHVRDDEATGEGLREALDAGRVTWPNATKARGANDWEAVETVVSCTWAVPRVAKLARADELLASGAAATESEAYREATHELEVAPMLQAEGRVRPHNAPRTIVRLAAPGRRAWVTDAEQAQSDRVVFASAGRHAFDRFGFVPTNQTGPNGERPLDDCAARVLELLAEQRGGVVVPRLAVDADPVLTRVFGVGSLSVSPSYKENGKPVRKVIPPIAAARHVLSVLDTRDRYDWRPALKAAGLAPVVVLAHVPKGRPVQLAVGVAPDVVDDERAVVESVREWVEASSAPCPWRSLSYRRARERLDADDLAGLLLECPTPPTGRRTFVAMVREAGLDLSERAARDTIKRLGSGDASRGVEQLQALWRSVHRVATDREAASDEGSPAMSRSAPKAEPRPVESQTVPESNAAPDGKQYPRETSRLLSPAPRGLREPLNQRIPLPHRGSEGLRFAACFVEACGEHRDPVVEHRGPCGFGLEQLDPVGRDLGGGFRDRRAVLRDRGSPLGVDSRDVRGFKLGP